MYPGCSVISDEEMYCSGHYDIDPAIVALICRRHGSRRGRALPDVRPEVAAE